MKKNIEQEIAFDVNNDNYKNFYPDNFQIDDELDEDIKKFFNNQNENNNIINNININNNNNLLINNENDNNDFYVNIYEDNLKISINEVYNKLNIKKEFINVVINEFNEVKNKLNELQKNCNYNNNFCKKLIINKNILIPFPNNEILITRIFPFLSNKYCLNQIKKIKYLIFIEKNKDLDFDKMFEWLYTFLLLIEQPLFDFENSILFELNKLIYYNFDLLNKYLNLKISFIIISEIYKQRIFQ